MSPPLLEMNEISKRFGATVALQEVSFSVERGQVMALIGENGAGKSTLMKILSGAYQPDSGWMEVAGRRYRPANPHHGRAAGIAMIYQELNLAPDLSVEDNIMLGQESSRWGLLRRRAQRPRVLEALDLLGHRELRPEQPVGRLSVGAQQLVEIARALVQDAAVIVFDEPTSSLTQQDAEHLFQVIRRLREKEIGIVYISHFLEEVREVCTHYSVLRDGRVAGSGRLSDVSEADIVSMMVGRSVEELFPTVPHEPGEPLLRVERLAVPGRHAPAPKGRGAPALKGRGAPAVNEVSLDVRRGEILGIAGLVGAGRTELLRCLFGLQPAASERVTIAEYAPRRTPRAMIAAGVGLVSEDRKGEGLAQIRSVADNVTYSRLAPYSSLGWLQLRRREAAVRDWMEKLRIRASSPGQAVVELSGGNQQKVALARVLHQDADVFLLDEPTRGVDVGTKAEIYRLMGELAARGKAILFVSSYFTELLAVCDRVAVMARGRLKEIRNAQDWTEESIMHCAVSTETP